MPRCCVIHDSSGTVYARCDVPDVPNAAAAKSAAKSGALTAVKTIAHPAQIIVLERSIAGIGEALGNVTQLTSN